MSRPLDPLALAVHVIFAIAVVAIGVGLFFFPRSAPEPAPQAEPPAATRQQAPRPMTQQPAPAAQYAPIVERPSSARTWRYRVTLQPDSWKDAELTYRMVEQIRGVAVYTEFRHAAGKMNFQLGRYAPADPAHANVRFPGFFVHAAYFEGKALHIGQTLVWQWPWQLPGGVVRDGRIKRYLGEVKAWENLQLPPGGPVNGAARIEATLQYIEDGKVMASAKETLWYAPGFHFLRVVREGRTPDEGFERIVAELAELR